MSIMQIRIERMGWVILYSLMSFITLFTSYQFVDDLERFVYPVISDFKVEKATRENGKLTLHGSMFKNRDCEAVALNAYTEKLGESPTLAFLNVTADGGGNDSNKIITRAIGLQAWGPWVVTAPDGPFKLSFFVRHRCNPLYDVTTDLTSVNVK